MNKKIKETRSLVFLYNTIIGRTILKLLINPKISNIYAKYMNSKLSKHKIKKFIKNNNINIEEYEHKNYNSFNDFFTRNIKKENRKIEKGLIAVADSRLTAYKIEEKQHFSIKNSIYTIEELTKEKENNYEYALIFRLSVDDYHHYCFPDSGKIISNKKIDGTLHTVRPIAFKKFKVFTENTREITYLDCKNLGKVCYIEVGAMMIGKIVNKKINKFKKGEEKGYFEFGGSTVILLIEKNKVRIKKEILENSKNGIETKVLLGENIGRDINEK